MSSSGAILQLRRGLVLQALHAQYPLPLMQAALDRQLGSFYDGDARAYARDLAYLKEKGLITEDRQQVADRLLVSLRLTSAGVDVVEGTVTDPGVEIVRP